MLGKRGGGMIPTKLNPLGIDYIKKDKWETIRDNVRRGKGKELYPVGTEFKTKSSLTNQDIVWVVRGHDTIKPANASLKHSLILETKYVYSGTDGSYIPIQFDNRNAMYSAEQELPAGTYNFKVMNQVWYGEDNNKFFQFTTTKSVPVNGQLFINMTFNQTLTGKTITSYASNTTTTPIETVTLTEGNGGTFLGATDGQKLNHMHRVVFGSNNYAQSAVRQWLNSDKAKGEVWTPQTKYNRPSSMTSGFQGFLKELPKDFINVIQTAQVPCRTNSVFECNSLDGTVFELNKTYSLEDKMFLLSRPEIFGTWDSEAVKDGEQLEYYKDLTDDQRKKYDVSGAVRYCWLRSPIPWSASSVGIVDVSGRRGYNNAARSYGVAPACIIA